MRSFIKKRHLIAMVPFVLLLSFLFIALIPPQTIAISVPADGSGLYSPNTIRLSSSSATDPMLYSQWGYFAVKADLAYAAGMTGINKTSR